MAASGLRRDFVSPAETVRALDGVDCLFLGGEFVAVFGASGSGKSTLFRTLAGLEKPDAGRVVVDGVDLTAIGSEERARFRLMHLGLVFQDHGLIPQLSLRENVDLVARAQGMSARVAKDAAMAELSRVGVGSIAHRRPGEVSGGQRQRAGIARALIGGRSILLADEPTGSLDTHSSRGVFTTFRELAGAGACVIVFTHDPLARACASRAMTMCDGRLAEET